jgi:pimeloyl-[acyl-carrier protein] synthase
MLDVAEEKAVSPDVIDLGINFGGVDFIADPYPTYKKLRDSGAPYWQTHSGPGGGMWLVTRYQDVAMLLKETHTTKSALHLKRPSEITPFDHTMLAKDPPEHTRLRSLASLAFTPARCRDLEPRIRQLVDELIDKIAAKDEMDFVSAFAMPLPAIVIAELLGVPPDDRDAFHQWSELIIRGTDELRTEADAKKGEKAGMALIIYFAKLIARRRQQPQDDLISALVLARDAQDRLTENELLALCMGLLVAGHTTTANLLANGLWTLLRHPEQLNLLKKNPDLLPTAIEEMLRYESPVQRATFRLSKEPMEIGGTQIPEGQQVSLILGAANRDPEVFSDPDTFDVTRQPNRHLAFGHGIHFCFGAPLGRAEARIGFSRLLERLPNLQLATDTPQWGATTFFRGLDRLPVVF